MYNIKMYNKIAKIGLDNFSADYNVAEEIDNAVREFASDMLDKALDTFDREVRQARQDEVEKDCLAHFADIYPDIRKKILGALERAGVDGWHQTF